MYFFNSIVAATRKEQRSGQIRAQRLAFRAGVPIHLERDPLHDCNSSSYLPYPLSTQDHSPRHQLWLAVTTGLTNIDTILLQWCS
jgi:hypothetical protein